jgi:hypothetical protein
MDPHNRTRAAWLVIIVMAHAVVSAVHGVAHQHAAVTLSGAAQVFVFSVIVAGPLLGAALIQPWPHTAHWIIAATMSASFVFGCVNHFLVAGPDHVAHVSADSRAMFGATAVLVAATEALGAWLAILAVRKGGRT